MSIWPSPQPVWITVLIVLFFLLTLFNVISFVILPLIKKNKKSSTQGTLIFVSKKEFDIFYTSLYKILQEKFMIQLVSRIDDQMRYAKHKGDRIRFTLDSIFLSELKERNASDLIINTSFVAYKFLLRYIQKEILEKVQQSFEDDNLEEMSNSEFKNYVDIKFKFLVAELTSQLNELYCVIHNISREDLYNFNSKYLLEFKPFISEIFMYARNTAINYNLRLLALEEEVDILVKRYIK